MVYIIIIIIIIMIITTSVQTPLFSASGGNLRDSQTNFVSCFA